MQVAANHTEAPVAIRTNLGAIFVSLELSRSKWLVTSISPGAGEKMSKFNIRAGDIAALLARFVDLQRKAEARTGQRFGIISIQEAGLDGFWIHRFSSAKASKAISSTLHPLRSSRLKEAKMRRPGPNVLNLYTKAGPLHGHRMPFPRSGFVLRPILSHFCAIEQ